MKKYKIDKPTLVSVAFFIIAISDKKNNNSLI